MLIITNNGRYAMRHERSLQNFIIVILTVAVLAMSIGFAAYEQNLNISGTATFTSSKWDVHFDTSSFNEPGTIKATTKDVGNTSVSYTVTLAEPGDVYTFSIGIKNYGTIDATLKKINMTGLTSNQQKYIAYTVNYDGTNYTQTTDNLNIGLAANETQTATVTVTVSYIKPELASDLPSADQTLNLTASFDYIDAN